MDHLTNNILFYSILPDPLLYPSATRLKDEESLSKRKPPDPALQNTTLQLSNLQIASNPNSEPLFSFQVDIERWEKDLRHLATLNRCAKSHTSDVKQAGEFLEKRLKEIPNVEVKTEHVIVNQLYESYNVIGTLKGTTHPDIWYVIGGHYDSTSENTKVAAPGALDNASGSAAVLELARIFSAATFPFTIVFILFTGEEQGFFGSKKFVQNMFISDEIYKVKLMLNLDMISLDVPLVIETRETDLAALWEKLAIANSLEPQVSFNIWGSDHVTFANAGVPSILTCSDHSNYPHYHRTTDLPENLNARVGGNTIRMNAQAIYARMQLDLASL